MGLKLQAEWPGASLVPLTVKHSDCCLREGVGPGQVWTLLHSCHVDLWGLLVGPARSYLPVFDWVGSTMKRPLGYEGNLRPRDGRGRRGGAGSSDLRPEPSPLESLLGGLDLGG